MVIKKLWFLLFSMILVFALEAKKSVNMNPVNLSDWGLPTEEKYATIYQLSQSNFKPKVLFSRDAWVIVIFKAKLHGKWRVKAEQLKGSVWFGAINYEKEKELAETWARDPRICSIYFCDDLSEETLKSGVALIFPYGKAKKENLENNKKRKWPKLVFEPSEVEKVLKKSIPDFIEKFTFKHDDRKNFQKWVIEAYYRSQPPKFPVLCITDEPEPTIPVSLLAISNYFSTFFAFGLVRKENAQNLISNLKEVPPPKIFPHYLILLGKEPSQDSMQQGDFGMTFNIFPYQHEKYGISDQFLSVVKYLFTANEDYRNVLPGRPSDEPVGLVNMAIVRTALTNRVKDASKIYKSGSSKTEL